MRIQEGLLRKRAQTAKGGACAGWCRVVRVSLASLKTGMYCLLEFKQVGKTALAAKGDEKISPSWMTNNDN